MILSSEKPKICKVACENEPTFKVSSCPIGPPGPPGSPGPPGPTITPAYGYAIRTFSGGQDRNYIVGQPVDLNEDGPLNDVVFDSTNDSLQIQRTGTYKVQFTVTTLTTATATLQSGVVLAIQVNNLIPVPQYFGQSAHVYLPGTSTSIVIWPQHSSAILELNSGDVVQIVPIEVFGNPTYRDAYLEIIQIV